MNEKSNAIKNKIKNLKDIGTIGGADILGTVITSIFWLYLPTVLLSEDYGEIHYILSIAGIGLSIALIGSRDSIIVFASKSIKVNSTLYFLSLLVGIIFVLIISFIFEINSVIILLGFLINDLSLGYLLGKKIYKKYFLYVITQKILTLTLGISFYFIFGYEGILYGLSLSYLPFVVIIYREFKSSKIDFNLFKIHRAFIFNTYALNIVGIFRSHFDKIIIVPLLGFSALGNYALSMQVFAVMMLASNIVYRYVLSHDAQGIQNIQIKKLNIFFSVFLAVLGIFVSPILIPIIFPNFIPAIDAIQIISLAVIPATVGQMLVSKLLGNEKSRPILISRILGAVLMILGIIILGPIFGIQGIAYSYLLSSLAMTVLLIIYSKKIGK